MRNVSVQEVFVIAEAGVNHNGDLQTALELVEVAADAGADAVKFQTFKAEKLVTVDAEMAEYQRVNLDKDQSQLAMLKSLELANEHHEAIQAQCRHRGIEFLSTPFDEDAADFLESLKVPRFKIPSGELTNLPFIRYVARKGCPMIVSTGMARIGEVEAAVEALESEGHSDFALLHCVSNYPADAADVNLRAMSTLGSFGYPVGYSDHTLGIGVSIAAVALGATIIEKHFTLDRNMEGPDHRASLEPDELSQLISEIREVEQALGTPRKRPAASELATARVARKSLVPSSDLEAGHVLAAADLVARRPGTGISPARLEEVIGRSLSRSVEAMSLLGWEDLE